MPLIQRLTHDNTIREFRSAAVMRFREASRLAVAGDRLAAVYLAGYSAEMLLKAAYFRLLGWTPVASITFSDLQDARSRAKTLGITWPGNLHDLTGWAALLAEERKLLAQAYAATFSRSLHARVTRVYLNWRETLRYRANRPYHGEVVAVLQGVQWLLGQFRFL